MPDIVIGRVNLRDLSYVLGALRPQDREEMQCQLPDDMEPQHIAATMVVPDRVFIVYLGLEPVAAFGFLPISLAGNVLSGFAYGTSKMTRRVVAKITRFVKTELKPRWKAAGVTRVEIRAKMGHPDAHRWLISAGAELDCYLWGWGKSGQTFLLYSWTRY